jgi:deferrochelatase/peroxidase EfeB
MDAGPVTPPPPAPGWKLADPVAAQTQGYVVTGFGALPAGRALFLRFGWAAGAAPKGFLHRLLAAAPVTNAVPPDKADPAAQTRAAAIAFAGTGLRQMGLSEATLATFSRPFREGMFQEDRLRRLGDRRQGIWQGTVVAGGPVWSANAALPALAPAGPAAFDVPPAGSPPVPIETKLTVHALLLLYTETPADAEEWAQAVQAVLAADGVSVVRTLDLVLDVEQAGFSREHFGFADALSQPLPYDQAGAVLVNGQPARTADPVQGVPLGEFLIGHIDGHHEHAPGPVVEDDPVARGAGLPASDQAEGFCDLGVNGSYLVARELKQDVAAFWRSMEANAAAMRAADPQHAAHITGAWLAERVVGRNRDGHLLCPANQVLPSCADGSPDSSFLFYDRDPRGAGCPPGSHLRRAFPRDALAPDATQKQTLLQAANNHRILRRGRKFGPKLADPGTDDGADRGLLFMCLNTDIERQFEFVQQTWLLNASFATLFQEVDPLVGPVGRMTIRDESLRRTADVDTFVRMAGGDYFFLPSLPALRYLADL